MTLNDAPSLLQVHRSLSAVSYVILYYDYLITLATEIEHFWPPEHRITWPSFLFFCNRYVTLLGSIPVVLVEFYGHENFEICALLQAYHHYYITTIQFLVAVLCTMRVSALYHNNRYVVGLLVLMVIGTIAISIWALPFHSSSRGLTGGVLGCHAMVPQSAGAHLAVNWSALVVFDFTVFCLTLYKALRIGWKHPGTLFHVLLRDGALYFVVLFFSNLSSIMTWLCAPPLLKGIASALSNMVSSVLISRLTLNLRVENKRMNEGRARGVYL